MRVGLRCGRRPDSPDALCRVVFCEPPALGDPVKQLAANSQLESDIVFVARLKVVPDMHDMRVIQVLEDVDLVHDRRFVLYQLFGDNPAVSSLTVLLT